MQTHKKGKSCSDDEENDIWDYANNVSVRLKESDTPKTYTIYFFHELDFRTDKLAETVINLYNISSTLYLVKDIFAIVRVKQPSLP